MKPVTVLDQRGFNSQGTRAKKASAGRRGTKDPGLQARIDKVVQRALALEAAGELNPHAQDVIHHISARLMMNGRARGVRIG